MDIADELERALTLHQQGLLLEAGQIYREILAQDSEHVDALNLLGVVMQAAGDIELAKELLERAAGLAPDYFAPHANLGNVLQASGREHEAIEAFKKALNLNPKSMETLNNLASALNDVERFEPALQTAEKALYLNPDFHEALINKGNALLGLKRPQEAVQVYKEALELDPENGNVFFNLGNAYIDIEKFDAAIKAYNKAVLFDAANAEKQFNLANAFLQSGQYTESLTPFERAIALKPGYVDAICNYASALQALGLTTKAIAQLQKALDFQPDSPDLHWNLSLAALQNGDWEMGWAEYEWRWRMPTFADFKRDFNQPLWKGEVLEGRVIFIHTEQGFGDNIQFCRYIPKVAELGGKVILECRPELERLFQNLEGVMETVTLGSPLPAFDFQLPLMSLPHVFGSNLDNLPANVPYLTIPEDLIDNPRIEALTGLRVGLVWSGSPTRTDNRKRSLIFTDLAPLLEVENVDFVSLQVGPSRLELDSSAIKSVLDLGVDLSDFADTAGVIDLLDLVISVDTSALHLAGAMGKPAWGIIAQPTGFLWMNERTDSPWYPSMRLFRQPQPGEWHAVIDEVKNALIELSGGYK